MKKGTPTLKECLKERILLFDGAMGTMLQSLNLCEDKYRGDIFKACPVHLKGNYDVLSLTCPDVVKDIHKKYLEAGCDVIRCNTFGANSVSQKDYKLQNYVKEMNISSIKLAKEVVAEYTLKSPDKPRFVAGVLGPTTKSASISSDISNLLVKEITFDELYKSYKEQTDLFVEYDVDLIIVETVFDIINAKAAVQAIKTSLFNSSKNIPVIISATLIDKSGRTLSGQTIEEFCYCLEEVNPVAFGLNCSMGIESMLPYIKRLNDIVSCGIYVSANAGLPDECGKYCDTPEEMAKVYKSLAESGMLNLCGGCCGTTPKHIEAIGKIIKDFTPKKITGKLKPISRKLDSLEFTKDDTLVVSQYINISNVKEFENFIIDGNIDDIDAVVKELIKKYSKQDIIKKYLLTSMKYINDKFTRGEISLTQLINGSGCIKRAIDLLKEFLPTDENNYIGTIVLATVKGDIHDIGKNIFSLILECNNFKIIDLGVMVPAIDIIKATRKYSADIVALSGLVTSSLDEMQNVARKFKSKGFKLPALMVGGATTSKKHTALKIAPYYDGLVVHTSNASEAAVAALKIMAEDKSFINEVYKDQQSYRTD